MKKSIAALLSLILIFVSCTGSQSSTGTLNIRIGGDIPVGNVKSVISAENQNGTKTVTEIPGAERTATLELPKGTYSITASFIGSDGEPHVNRHTEGIAIREGEERGLTIRLPEDNGSVARLAPSLPNLEFGTEDPAVKEALKAQNYTITLWHGENGRNAAALEAVINAFNESNDYGITVEPYAQGNNGVLHMKAMSALMTETAPDIVMDEAWRINEYVPSGRVLSLSSYINDGYGLTEEDYRTINPVFMMESSSYGEGDMLSSSLGKSAQVMFYNKSFTDKNSINIPRNVLEITESARKSSKITEKPSFALSSKKDLAITGPIGWGASYSAGKEPCEFYEGVNVGRTYGFYDWWKYGVGKELYRTEGEDRNITEPYGRGDVIFFIGPSNMAPILGQFDFRTAVAPVPKSSTEAILIGGPVFAGFTSGDDLKDLAISIVLEWFWSPEAGEIYSSITGAMPSNEKAMEGAISVAEGLIKDTLSIIAEYPENALYYPPLTMDSGEIMKALTGPIDGIENSSRTIDSLIDEAIVKLRKIAE